jgi:hypothetical protein
MHSTLAAFKRLLGPAPMSEAQASGAVIGVVLLMLLALPLSAAATQLKLKADRLQLGDIELRGLQLQLDWAASATEGRLQLDVGEVDSGIEGYAYRNLQLQCLLQRVDAGWHCSGDVEAAGHGRGKLTVTSTAQHWRSVLRRDAAALTLTWPTGAAGGREIVLAAVPLEWLQPLLTSAWPEARFTAGAVDATLGLTDDASRLAGSLRLREFALDSIDGRIAAAGLNAAGSMAVGLQTDTSVELDMVLQGGELLAGQAYVELPASAVDLTLRAQAAAGTWRIEQLGWRDGEALTLQASATIGPDAADGLGAYVLRVHSEQLQALTARYLGSILAAAGLPALQASGELTLEAQRAGQDASTVLLDLADVYLDTGDGRLRLSALDGELRWTSAADTQSSALGWEAAELYGISLGAAQSRWASRAGAIGLDRPLRVAALQGRVELQQLRWTPASTSGDRQTGFELALQLDDLDLGQLSEQLGWPSFEGRLGGRLPKASYADGRLVLDGALEVDVFDGQLVVDGLQLERPFGVAPTLSANVGLRDLDLQPLTAAFGFGEITGRLEGAIAGLRMVNWQPVAFDAHFASVTRAGVPRRISQRAVNDLSRVGGGLAGGLQASALRLFDSFGYSRIGLGCRLHNNVCEMSGIRVTEAGSAAAGYTVVEGAGLPRITVNGFQRRVDWPVLVARLKAVTEGQAPRIE